MPTTSFPQAKAMPRDQALISRLAAYLPETDLPSELRNITEPRLEVIHTSRIHRYWCFMNDPSNPPPMPVPPSITNPNDPLWQVLNQQLTWDAKQDALLPIYGLSEQERIQLRDAYQYTVMNAGRRTKAKPDQLHTFAARVILQLGDILAAGGMTLRATIHQTPGNDFLIVCRFDMTTHNSPDKAKQLYQEAPLVDTKPPIPREEICQMLPQEALSHVANIGPREEKLRVYDGTTFWRVASKTEHLWSEAQALLEADEVMQDHMNPKKENDENSNPTS